MNSSRDKGNPFEVNMSRQTLYHLKAMSAMNSDFLLMIITLVFHDKELGGRKNYEFI